MKLSALLKTLMKSRFEEKEAEAKKKGRGREIILATYRFYKVFLTMSSSSPNIAPSKI